MSVCTVLKVGREERKSEDVGGFFARSLWSVEAFRSVLLVLNTILERGREILDIQVLENETCNYVWQRKLT